MSRLLPVTDTKSQRYKTIENSPAAPHLFRLFVKNGEYIYARSNDIILIESCDHWIKVYLAFSDQIKKTSRHDTLKNFLTVLSNNYFIRLGRFCAVNSYRLSGGSYNEQTFEFDFKIKIKLQHPLSNDFFRNMGKVILILHVFFSDSNVYDLLVRVI